VHLAPQAERDLDAAFLYLTHEAGLPVGVRFDEAVEAVLWRLVALPGMGAPVEHEDPRLAGVRRFPVPGFRSYLLFYRENSEGILVLRVLHGARDLDPLLMEGAESDVVENWEGGK
jgi:toxin ParE1/3/4